MSNYSDNLICETSWDKEYQEEIKKLPKAKGYLPFETYDLVQCGYPLPNHGEMILRSPHSTNEKGELLPTTGMWCKVSDIKKLLKNMSENNGEIKI